MASRDGDAGAGALDAGALLARWQESGDRSALEELLALEVAWLKARIRAHGMPRGEPVASASDIAQEAVMRLLRLERTPRFPTAAAMRAYLWRAAWNLLADRLERRTGARRIEESASRVLESVLITSGGFGAVDAGERALALQLTVQLLEPGEREILELVYFQGLEIEGAARALGVSRDAAKMRCARARAKLARKLARWSGLVG